MKKVIIMRGIPGSGKSTVVRRIINSRYYQTYAICSADDFRMINGEYVFKEEETRDAHNKCMRMFLGHVMNGIPVIFVDNTNISVIDFMPYVRVAEALGYDVEVVEVVRDIEKCVAQNVHRVPREVIERMWDSIDWTPEYLTVTRLEADRIEEEI